MSDETAHARILIRTQLEPGDMDAIVRLHGQLYAEECGFDRTFEAYVAAPLARAIQAADPDERIWMADRGSEAVGCIAIVRAGPSVAQLRWFLVHPSCRGTGLGKRLLSEAIAFCRDRKYETVMLWTVAGLPASAHLYRFAGFQKVEEKPPARIWGVTLTEERHELRLD